MNYDDIERCFEIVSAAREKHSADSGFEIGPVTDEEKSEAYRWANGQELKHVVDTPGYEVIMGFLQGYMDDGITALFKGTNPTDKDAVLAKFAIGYAACEIFDRLKNDIKASLEAAETVPEIVKQGIRVTRGVPVNAVSE